MLASKKLGLTELMMLNKKVLFKTLLPEISGRNREMVGSSLAKDIRILTESSGILGTLIILTWLFFRA